MAVHLRPMDDDLPSARPATFVLRVSAGDAGTLSGLIHHLRSGEKRRFDNVHELSAALFQMVRNAGAEPENP